MSGATERNDAKSEKQLDMDKDGLPTACGRWWESAGGALLRSVYLFSLKAYIRIYMRIRIHIYIYLYRMTTYSVYMASVIQAILKMGKFVPSKEALSIYYCRREEERVIPQTIVTDSKDDRNADTTQISVSKNPPIQFVIINDKGCIKPRKKTW